MFINVDTVHVWQGVHPLQCACDGAVFPRSVCIPLCSVMEARKMSAAGRPEHAVARLSRAIILKQDDPELFKERAEASVLIQDYHAAIINFQKVIALRESEREGVSRRLSEVCYQYGVALAAEAKYTEAVEMFISAARYDPRNKDSISKR